MAVIGTGVTVTFQSGLFAEILSLNWTGVSREMPESTHMGITGGRTFLAGTVYDPGQLEAELAFHDPDGAWITAIDAALETCTVTFSNGNTWSASGGMSDFSYSVPLEDRMTATATIKLSGNVTLAAT